MNTDKDNAIYISNPYSSTWQLYTMHFFYSFVSNMWDMGIVLMIASLTNNSMYLIALCGFVSALATLFSMPIIGIYLDKHNRLLKLLQYHSHILFV